MRYIIITSIVCLSIACYSQKKCKLKTNEVDEFTGRINKSTVDVSVATYMNLYNLKCYASQYDSAYFLTFFFPNSSVNLGCVSERDSYLYIKFTDDKVIKFNHTGDVDCGGLVFLSVNITDAKDLLKKTSIKKIRIAFESSADLELNDPDIIARTISCLD